MSKRQVTIHDIAKELHVTASTISRALHNHPRISDSMKKKVADLAQKLDYQPNAMAAGLRKGQKNTIAVVIPRIDRYFFSSVIRGIEDIAYLSGYHVLICQSYDSYEREKDIIHTLIRGKVDGLLVSISAETIQYDHFNALKSKHIPLVFFDRVAEPVDASKIVLDDEKGAFDAVEHLIKEGCQKIAHFSGPQHINVYKNRLKGYKKALHKYHIPLIPELIFENTITKESGEIAANKIRQMNPMPDGLFAAGDFSALGAYLYFSANNIKIPKDIAIVGFANEPYTEYLTPALSSIDQHSREIGESAGRLILEEITNKGNDFITRRIILTPELVIRASSLKKRST
jgi:LacI family transcriptional regulator